MGLNRGSPKRRPISKTFERFQVNNLMVYLKTLEKQEQTNPNRQPKSGPKLRK